MVESLADLRTLERFEEEQDESGIKYGKSTGLNKQKVASLRLTGGTVSVSMSKTAQV